MHLEGYLRNHLPPQQEISYTASHFMNFLNSDAKIEDMNNDSVTVVIVPANLLMNLDNGPFPHNFLVELYIYKNPVGNYRLFNYKFDLMAAFAIVDDVLLSCGPHASFLYEQKTGTTRMPFFNLATPQFPDEKEVLKKINERFPNSTAYYAYMLPNSNHR